MHLPAAQTSDQYIVLQCWAESLDSPRSAAETHRPAAVENIYINTH